MSYIFFTPYDSIDSTTQRLNGLYDPKTLLAILIPLVYIMSTMEINIKEARQRFSELVNAVAHGKERIVITSRKKPKAVLVSLQDAETIKNDLAVKTHRRIQLSAIAKMRDKLAKRHVRQDLQETLNTLREERLVHLSDNN